jgi:hypothetical protein
VACPGPKIPRSRGCGPCNIAFLPANAAYIAADVNNRVYCRWKCNPGYFASGETQGLLAKITGGVGAEYFANGETSNECVACTVQNETNCPAGMVPRDCTDSQDFTCSVPCDSALKPILNSRWLSNCKWECEAGHESITTSSGLSFCRAE